LLHHRKVFPNSPAWRFASLNAKFGDALLLKLADEKNAARDGRRFERVGRKKRWLYGAFRPARSTPLVPGKLPR
jgi:hypothetical protein